MMPRVAAIILNWNGLQVLPELLSSLKCQTFPLSRISVVDNASRDGSLEWVARHHPDVLCLRNSENVGFSAGCNLGIEEALAQHPDYLLILNNDLVLEPEALRELLADAEQDKRIGLAGPSLWLYEQPERLDSAYGRILFNHVIAQRLAVGKDRGVGFLTPCDVGCLFGAALLVRAQVFQQIGLLDPTFFMFLEEVDFCYRAGQGGFRIRYVPAARIRHRSGYSIRRAHADLMMTYLVRRNSVLFLRKHGTAPRWAFFMMMVGLSLSGTLLRALVSGDRAPWVTRWQGYRDGFLKRPVDARMLSEKFQLAPRESP